MLLKQAIDRLAVMVCFTVVTISATFSLAACQLAITPKSTRTVPSDGLVIGPLQRVSQVEYVFEPHIAAVTANPDHLAAIAIAAPRFECNDPITCSPYLALYRSIDGGMSWVETTPFGSGSWDGVVGFGPDGALYANGLYRLGSIGLIRLSPDMDFNGELTKDDVICIQAGSADKPWLTVDPQQGTLYVAYMYKGPAYAGISFNISTDGGASWSDRIEVVQGISTQDMREGKLPPIGAQVMLGEENSLAVAYMWSEIAPRAAGFPQGVWVTISHDHGYSFSDPKEIGETWGIISTAAHDGAYYVLYRQGTIHMQTLHLAVSHDNGGTWETSLVSSGIPLYFDWDKAAGIDIAPDGTIDIVFYAHGKGAPDCIELERKLGWVDACVYNVYYTFSRDNGQTFHVPIQINEDPIVGARFVRTGGSRPGEYIGMASTNAYAYPIWIDTRGEDGAQAYTARIER